MFSVCKTYAPLHIQSSLDPTLFYMGVTCVIYGLKSLQMVLELMMTLFTGREICHAYSSPVEKEFGPTRIQYVVMQKSYIGNMIVQILSLYV